MANSTIRLIVVNEADLNHQSMTSGEPAMMRKYRLFNAPASSSPNEVIQREFGLPLETTKRVSIEAWPRTRVENRRRMCTLVTSYQLKCPALRGQLDGTIPLSAQGIVDDTVLVLTKREWHRYDRPEDNPEFGVSHMMMPVSGVKKFNSVVHSSVTDINLESYPYGWSLLAALLYTEDDFELAKYMRLNYLELDMMSGRECTIIVVERPPKSSLLETINYWKELLAFEAYVFWASTGWARTRPYDKATAYDIARQLGVFAHQLPCVVFFEDITDEDKVIVPVQGQLTKFFRMLFGYVQEVFLTSQQRDRLAPGCKGQLKLIRDKVTSHGKETAADEHTLTYNFNGQTVFINHPAGPIDLSNFQKTVAKSSDILKEGE